VEGRHSVGARASHTEVLVFPPEIGSGVAQIAGLGSCILELANIWVPGDIIVITPPPSLKEDIVMNQ
jgi:hypothetical protein